MATILTARIEGRNQEDILKSLRDIEYVVLRGCSRGTDTKKDKARRTKLSWRFDLDKDARRTI